MQQVTHDGNLEAVEVAKLLAHRVEVEQGLRGVRVLAIAGVDDVGIRVLRDEVRRAGVTGTANEHVNAVGGKRLDGVLKAFALGNAGTGALDIQRVGGKALLGNLEARARARGGLEE